MPALPFVPEQTLRARCEPVYDVQEAQCIIRELQQWYDRLSGECIGLAAPQIGIPKSVAIIRANGQSYDLINPELFEQKDPFIFHGEGCMSFPGKRWDVPRFKEIGLNNSAIWPPEKPIAGLTPKVDGPNSLLVRQQTRWSYQGPFEDVPNLLPVIMQHEIDHLLGICLPWKEGAVEQAPSKPIVKSGKDVGRNDPCPCGSGVKFKKCCLDKVPLDKIAVSIPPL